MMPQQVKTKEIHEASYFGTLFFAGDKRSLQS